MSTEQRTYGPTALLTPANLLTAFRLVITPIFIWLIVQRGASWITAGVGFVAAVSDYFDGIVARRQGTTTSGAFLDPLADKVVVLGSLFTLAAVGRMAWLPVIIITLREAWMTWYRSKSSKLGISIPARTLPKWKTFIQDWAIAFCVLPPTANLKWLQTGTLWIAVVLTLYTGWQYFDDGRKAVVA